MKKWGLVLMLIVVCTVLNKVQGQSISNEGRDFWAVFPTHDPAGGVGDSVSRAANITIYITSKFNTEAYVTVNGNRIYAKNQSGQDITDPTISANTPMAITIPRKDAYISEMGGNRLLKGLGIHITVPAGKPKIAVYAHIFAGQRSAASLILPNESLGQQYYSMNFTQTLNQTGTNKNFLALVAVEPNTRLKIHVANSSEVITVFLPNAGDVYEYMPGGTQDITGTFVEVDPNSVDACTKKFAAFSGSTAVAIGCPEQGNNLSRDPLYQQLYPPTSWGKNYGIVPFINRRYLYRVVAQEDGTDVRVNGVSVTTLRRGEFYPTTDNQQILTEPTFISSNKNISVAQYSLSQVCTGTNGSNLEGDPEMVLLNPIEFNIKAVTLFSSTAQNITARFINVFMKTASRETFKINGQSPTDGSSWQTMPLNEDYSYRQISIANLSSTLTANDGFNAIAYGFGSFESYSYSAGTNLAANNYLLVANKVTNIDAPNACIGQKSNFKIVLSYKAKAITWNLDDTGDVRFANPTPDSTIITADGESYVYIYNIEKEFPALGEHNMVVTAEQPNDANCLGSNVVYNFSFEVTPIPTAKFIVDPTPCPDTEVTFTDDNSDSHVTSKPVNKWFWDFGDDSTSTQQNPVHIYKRSGKFIVKFSAGLDDGCMSDIIEQEVNVKSKLTTLFNVSATGCVNTSLVFTDRSTIEAGTIVKWYWDFGDGGTSGLQNPNHLYAAEGTYTVKLIVESRDGCKSVELTKDVVINKLPIPDFELPGACIDDPSAVFKNLSADAEGGTAGLTYVWNFNDPNSTAANNTSTQTNGSHKYLRAGLYNVSLSVTNANGCSATITKEFSLNGSQVAAAFTVKDTDNLCSNKDVVLKNASGVNIGNVTRVIFYMDAVNNPTVQSIVDEDPTPGKEYNYKYPAFTTPVSKSFTVRMVAFSGETCFEETTKIITVKPSPKLVFEPIPSACLNDGRVQITQARETLGVPGTGRFSGNGITQNGLFDPVAVGVGIHTITYTYSGSNSCDESITQTITVQTSPLLTLPSDIFILIGGKKTVEAQATGTGLTYKWSPTTGLSDPNILNPVMQGDDDREYTLTVTNSLGCTAVQKIRLNILRVVEPASAFSPNGDGVNDTWGIKYIDSYPDVSVQIFNRYGTRIYFSNGYARPFDGNFNNEVLPVGTYYYIINPNIGTKSVTGALTIIR
ncbi:MAG: PKD domain-containing protein [Bacteroidota bacterium]